MDEQDCRSAGGDWVGNMCQYGSSKRASAGSSKSPLLKYIGILAVIAVAGLLVWQVSTLFAVAIAPIVTMLALMYLISPIDILPDIIPLAGWLDDAIVIGIAIATWFMSIGLKRAIFFVVLAYFGLKMYLRFKR